VKEKFEGLEARVQAQEMMLERAKKSKRDILESIKGQARKLKD
jgi:hypothetical protein